MISSRFWQSRFGGARDVVGRQLSVNRVRFTIVGVLPPGFLGPEVGRAMDVFLPLASEAAIRGRESYLAERDSWWLGVVARLKPGQSIDQAAAALNAVRPAIREATTPPESDPARHASLESRYMYGRISGFFIKDNLVYAIDSESGPLNHVNWRNGVRIGPIDEDRITAFIPPFEREDRVYQGTAGEGVAVDAAGNVYAAEGPNSLSQAGGAFTKYSVK